jgi:predicted MFS family arabinose efflux permease
VSIATTARIPSTAAAVSGWPCILAATILIALVVGSRSSFGLFLSPINTATGLGLAALGFAAALGQLGQGVAQPLVGALAERYGATRLIMAGSLAFFAATASLPAVSNAVLLAALVVLTGIAGTAMGSISMLLGEVGRRVPPERQGLAMGIVGAGGSAGQLLIGPLTQTTIELAGWVSALWVTAALGLVAMPLALVFRRPSPFAKSTDDEPEAPACEPSRQPATAGLDDAVRAAIREPRFWQIGGGFAACGFHMSFLTMHMPGVIDGCGLPASLAGVWLAVLGIANIAGSLAIGLLLKRCAPASLLVVLHVLRAVFITCLLAVPATPGVMLVFAAAMGMTYMAALPPTTMLVTRTFGPRRVATLFGFVMLLHQTGSFAGSWLGGVAAGSVHGYRTLWLVDIGLALLAAAVYLPSSAASRACSVERRTFGSIGLRSILRTPQRCSSAGSNSSASPV